VGGANGAKTGGADKPFADGTEVLWLVALNFTPIERTYRAGVPYDGQWQEILNTDAQEYGGTGTGNLGTITADTHHSAHSRPHSIAFRLPAMSAVVFRKVAR
jgi:1,4-alpha-glucan branching enzyme